MENNTTKVWISKYALTKGVYEMEAKIIRGTMCEGNTIWDLFHKPHWHHTKEEAIAQAGKMREAKLKSLQKQIDKLTKMKFE